MQLKVYYVRHGETLFNVIGRSQGWCDSPLTENGLQQAEQCRLRLQNTHIDCAYCSSLERAADTAEIILKDRNVPLKKNRDLREMYFGTLEASRGSEDMKACWLAHDFTSFGGENEEMLSRRIRNAFQLIEEESADGESVLVVSHRGYFYYMLSALFGLDVQRMEKENPDFMNQLIPNASVAVLNFRDGSWSLGGMPK